MRQLLITFAVVGLMAAMQFGCTSSDGAHNYADSFFIGLWEGIDPLDGSEVLASITNIDGDDTIEILWRETFYTLCEGDQGIVQGTGTIGEDGILRTDEFLTCFNKEVTVNGKGVYTPSEKDQLLIITYPENPELEGLILHQVSSRM